MPDRLMQGFMGGGCSGRLPRVGSALQHRRGQGLRRQPGPLNARAARAAEEVSADAQAQALVDEKDAQAAALGYVADAKRVDVKKFPKFVAGQNCASCALYQGKATDKAAGCPLFAGKQVASAGWCSAWAKKA